MYIARTVQRCSFLVPTSGHRVQISHQMLLPCFDHSRRRKVSLVVFNRRVEKAAIVHPPGFQMRDRGLLLCKSGSIIAMDARVWHTSGANTTADVDRPLLFGYYSAPFLRQQVNWTAKLPQDVKDDLNEELQQRLGLGATANTGRTGDLRYMSVQYPEAAKV